MSTIDAALRLAVVGLSVTFAALLLLRVIIGMLARFTAAPDKAQPQVALQPQPQPGGECMPTSPTEAEDADIAAIMAVLETIGVTPKLGGRIRIEEIPG